MLASLDWLIALTFVYALLSLLATALQEGIASFLGLRAQTLRRGIAALLEPTIPEEVRGDKAALDPVNGVFASPFFQAMRANSAREPSYLAPAIFSQAVISHLRTVTAKTRETVTSAGELIQGLPESSPAKSILLQVTDQGRADLKTLERELSLYFDAGMERASGWFKRQTQRYILLIGFLAAVLLDANAFEMARRLATDQALRFELVQMAEKTEGASVDPAAVKARLDQAGIGLPFGRDFSVVGREKFWALLGNELSKIPGWFISAIAISLGAPFWFDLLAKFMRVRGATVPKTTLEREAIDADIHVAVTNTKP